MWSPPSTSRPRRSLLIAVAFVLALLYMYNSTFRDQLSFPPVTFPHKSPPTPQPDHQVRISELKAQVHFWQILSDAYAASEPGVERPVQALDPIYNDGFDANAKLDRPDLLLMKDIDVEKMKMAHQDFVAKIQDPEIKPFFNGGTRGVVTTTGPRNLPALILSIRMLRVTGSTLPVQVFLADEEEYNSHVCEAILPTLDAECRLFSDIIDFSSRGSPDLKMYQYKIFAILFSTFDEVLWLDADAFPIRDPSYVFDSDPYTSHSFILWPDFWIGTQSPYYYAISSQEAPPMNLRASSETGEMFVSKAQHWRSLLLASYYNYYGPSHYYHLLSQGSMGEGDKETFLAAATALNGTIYTVSEPIQALGSSDSEGAFHGSAMVQFDPSDDFDLTSQGLFRAKNEAVAQMPRPLFIHANCPKLDPGNVFEQNQEFASPVKDAVGRYRRAWIHNKDIIEAFGWDIEKALWKEAVWVACKMETHFVTWKGKHAVCSEMKSFFGKVFENQPAPFDWKTD